jgi:hypothetical protein
MKNKAVILLSVGFLVLLALVVYLAASRPVRTVQELSQAQFLAKFQSNLIGQLQISYPPEPPLYVPQVCGTFYDSDAGGHLLQENGAPKDVRFHASFGIPDELMRQFLADTNIKVSIVTLNPIAQKAKDVFSRGK